MVQMHCEGFTHLMKVLTMKMITKMLTVAGGGGAILEDDILSPESEAGRSYDWLEYRIDPFLSLGETKY